MPTQFFHRSSRGFSLIEVLIAVVILSVGLLALASLQVNLIRSSAGTKTQSIAMGLAKQRLEQLTAFQDMGGSNTTCISPVDGISNTCYRAITDVPDDAPSVGGVTFARTVAVTRYVYDKSAGSAGFKLQGSNTALDSALLTSPVTFLAGKEFKRLVATVAWTDAAGSPRSVVVEDAIGAINPADSAAVSKTTKGATPRKARSIITNPASVAGVIPIAIGNGSDTAATNPRPIIVSQGQNSTTVETRFDVYTYAALSGSAALAQSRVETAVVGCSCTLATGTHSAARPTYWNGTQYTIPTTASGIPNSTPTNVTQSEQCTVCCRDHHDPGSVTGEKFDPRRTPHNHYLKSALGTVVTTGDYSEACRLIRVDGIFHVAAEPYNDHYGLLATPSIANSTSATVIANMVPAASVQTLYQTFVINYLASRFVTGTSYNTVSDPTATTGYSALQAPTTATIDTVTKPQYLHSRGLLIDYLSTEAIAAIAQAKADCAALNVIVPNSCPSATLQTNVLKKLPFTSINATELAKWSSTNSSQIDVHELTDLSESIDYSFPASGKADYIAGTTGTVVTGNTTIQGTSAGLAITPQVFPAAAYAGSLYSMSDAQPFQVGASPAVVGNGSFNINWLGGALASATNGSGGNKIITKMIFGNSSAQQPPCGDRTTNDGGLTYINDGLFKCSPSTSVVTLPNSVTIQVTNYNRAASPDKQVQNACNSASPTTTTGMPYVLNYDVSSYSVNGGAAVATGLTVVNPNQANASCTSGECTSFTAAGVANATVIDVTFSAASKKCPDSWSIYLNTNGTAKAYPGNSNCNAGTPKTPKWGTTYGANATSACPSGLTLP